MAFIKNFAFGAVLLFAVSAQQTFAQPTASEEIVYNVEKIVSEATNKIQKNIDAIENHMKKNFFTADEVIARNFAFANNFLQIYSRLASFSNERISFNGVCRDSYLNSHATHDEIYKAIDKCVQDRAQIGTNQFSKFVDHAKQLIIDLTVFRQEAEKCVAKYKFNSSEGLACVSENDDKAKEFIRTKVPHLIVSMSKQYENILSVASNINFCTSPEHIAELQTKYMQSIETVAKCLDQ